MGLKWLLAALVLFCASASAANVSGTVYEWDTLQPLKYAIVEVNTTPKQLMVSDDGHYAFNAGDGNYTLKGMYFEANKLRLEASENLVVNTDGNFTVDLIMLPAIDTNSYIFGNLNDVGVQFDTEARGYSNGNYMALLTVLLLAAAAAIIFLRVSKGTEPQKNQGTKEHSEEVDSDPEIGKVLSFLQSYGGRMTQKELREKTGIGEAKLSLLVAELEHDGKVKKFKKGRGNVVVLSHTAKK